MLWRRIDSSPHWREEIYAALNFHRCRLARCAASTRCSKEKMFLSEGQGFTAAASRYPSAYRSTISGPTPIAPHLFQGDAAFSSALLAAFFILGASRPDSAAAKQVCAMRFLFLGIHIARSVSRRPPSGMAGSEGISTGRVISRLI